MPKRPNSSPRSEARGDGTVSRAEALVNEALQKSNLGRYAEAEALFDARRGAGRRRPDRRPPAAQLSRDAPAQPGPAPRTRSTSSTSRCRRCRAVAGTASAPPARSTARPPSGSTPKAMSASSSARRRTTLLPEEKARDPRRPGAAAARHRAAPDRRACRGRRSACARPTPSLPAVRGGRVASIVWMRAQILGDLARDRRGARQSRRGRAAVPRRASRCSRPIIRARRPCSTPGRGSPAISRAVGQVGDGRSAVPRDRRIRSPIRATCPPSFARVLRPYVDLLLAKGDAARSDRRIVRGEQLMVRPGVAQTQAVLARELSGGSDEASRLFRQSVTLTRQVERSADRACPARGDCPARRPKSSRATACLRASTQAKREAAGRDPGRACRLPALPRGFERRHAARRSAEVAAAGRGLLQDDRRRRSMSTPSLATATPARAVKLDVTAKQLDEQVDALARDHLDGRAAARR